MTHIPSVPFSAAKPAGFDGLCAYLRKASGLVLDAGKAYLVESKLLPIVQREGLSGLEQLVQRLERGDSPRLAGDVLQAMTINETYFFRDMGCFTKFREIMLPQLIHARAAEKTLRIWSAACSTGQEPYSIALLLADAAPMLQGWRVEVLATDLAEAALNRARKGLYAPFEVQRGLPERYLPRHFKNTGTQWQISESIRAAVTFRQFNLLADFSPLGRFDIILCRNVLIYFDAERKVDILSRLARSLAPDGYLMLGASESILARNSPFKPAIGGVGIFQHAAVAAGGPQPRQGSRELPGGVTVRKVAFGP